MQNISNHPRPASGNPKRSFGGRAQLSEALIEQARRADMLALIKRYGVELKEVGAEFIGACVICGGTDRFSYRPHGRLFHCRGCARGGKGAIDLLIFLSGIGFADAVGELMTGKLSGELRSQPADDIRRDQERQQRDAETEKRQHVSSNKIWRDVALSPAGTIVETYLRVRGYRGDLAGRTRFLPASARYPTPRWLQRSRSRTWIILASFCRRSTCDPCT